MAFAFIGNVINLAVRYAPAVIGLIKTGYDIISQIRDDSNPIDTLSQTSLDNIDHISDICGRINNLLGGGLTALPPVNSPADLPGWMAVVSSYFEAFRNQFASAVSQNMMAVRAYLPPASDDFTGDEQRAGGVNPTSASTLIPGSVGANAYANVTNLMSQYVQYFPLTSSSCEQSFPIYAESNKYISPGFNLLQKNTFAGYLDAAARGLSDLATGGPICPIDHFNLANEAGPWLVGTEGDGVQLKVYAQFAPPNWVVTYDNLEDNGTGYGPLNLTVAAGVGSTTPGVNNFTSPKDVDLFALMSAMGALTNVGTNTHHFTLQLTSPDGSAPPKFPLTYHWIAPLIFSCVGTGLEGVFIRTSGSVVDRTEGDGDESYYFPLDNSGVNVQPQIGVDVITEISPGVYDASINLTILPVTAIDQVNANVQFVSATPLICYGLLTDTGLTAADITYFNSDHQIVPINNSTTFFSLLGLVDMDDIHDDPNASVSALFTQRFGPAAQAFGQVLGAYAQYQISQGVNYQSVYATYGLTLEDLVDMKSWLSTEGPFVGLTDLQKATLIKKLIMDVYSVLEYSQFNTQLMTQLVSNSEPLPTASVF